MVKNLPHNAENVGSIPGTGRLPGRKEWLPISIARRIPWTEEPDSRIQPMGSKESDTSEQLTHTYTHIHTHTSRILEGMTQFCFSFLFTLISKREWAQALKIAFHQELLKASIYVDNCLNKKLNLLDVMTVRQQNIQFHHMQPITCILFICY